MLLNRGNVKKSFRDLDGSEDEKGGFKMTSSSRGRREHKGKLKTETTFIARNEQFYFEIHIKLMLFNIQGFL